MQLHDLGIRFVETEAVVDEEVRVLRSLLVRDLGSQTHLEVPLQGEVRVRRIDLGEVCRSKHALGSGVKPRVDH